MTLRKEGSVVVAAALGVLTVFLLYFLLCDGAAKAANPALFEANLSPTATTTGEYCALSDQAFNISVYYTSTGSDPGVTIQRAYRSDTPPVWRDIKEYTSNTETIETNAPNPSEYWYRAKYTGASGAAHVRIDQ
ncbi:MAG: hypothetical protein ABFD81_06600 [Syntrophaceae bacterium]